jgi:uncharacterized membrane protein YdjX (TVP38/TMEM64 family)
MRRLLRVLVVLVVVAIPMLATQLPPVKAALIALVELMREGGALGVLAYSASFSLGAILTAPIAIFSVMAGYAYGPLYGVLVASPSCVLATTLTFLVGRKVARERIARRIERDPRFATIDRAIGVNGLKIVLLLRLTPIVPQNFLSYMLAVTSVRLRDVMLATFAGLLPVICLQAYVGSLVRDAAELFEQQGLPSGPWTYVVPALGLVASIAAVVVTSRVAKKALDRELAAVAAPEGGHVARP